MGNTITLGEFKETFKYLIQNNFRLIDRGIAPISIGLEGPCGIGKTSIIEEVAKELGMTYVRLGLAELEEVGDLCGLPLKEFEVTFKDCPDCPKWVSADILNNIHKEFEFTGASRMSYATPAWLPREENPNGILINVDDFTRANSLFQQALMELIRTGKYMTWDLPSKALIALTSNPDNGEFSVTSLDPAQQSRYIDFSIKFNIDDFAQWAERNSIDNRAINFAISYSHEIFENEKQLATINPRSFIMFANAISGLPNWQNPNNLAMILNIAKGCFRDEDNIIGNLFTTFIANKLDTLVSPQDMLLGNWEEVYPKIKKSVYDEDDTYRPAIAAILHTRLLNYTDYYFSQKDSDTQTVIDRFLEIAHSEKMLFDEDILFDILKTLAQKYPQRMQKAYYNPEIRARILV